MSRFLASVNSLEEALQILEIGVDILDLKQPAQGALGALDSATIQEIVAMVAGRCPISATVGDLPMHPERVFKAVTEMTGNGVDFIKLGFFPGGDWNRCVTKLAPIAAQGHVLVAVLFADTEVRMEFVETLKAAGFKGVMLDTMDKRLGPLTEVMPLIRIAEFVDKSKQCSIMSGLAGSLDIADIPKLTLLNPDYLGFRGALCDMRQRTAQLNPDAIRSVKNALHR